MFVILLTKYWRLLLLKSSPSARTLYGNSNIRRVRFYFIQIFEFEQVPMENRIFAAQKFQAFARTVNIIEILSQSCFAQL